MSLERKFRHPDAVPFFVSPPAWVLVHEPAPGRLHVATESADEGRAILRFLSPLDALIEAIDLIARYREFHAERLAGAAIAKAQAQCLTVEIYALRAMVGMGAQDATR